MSGERSDNEFCGDGPLGELLRTLGVAEEHGSTTVCDDRIAVLVRKSQNHMDRAWNRALDEVTRSLALTPDDANTVRMLRKRVRHAQEFGER